VSGERLGEGVGEVEVLAVAVRLSDAGDSAACDDFDDEAGGVRLVDALGVEQGRIGHEDRGEADRVDDERGGGVHT